MKLYPIKNENGEVVELNKITSVIFLENVAGCVIGLNGKDPSILLSLEVYNNLQEE